METGKDISSRADIELLIHSFYEEVKSDPEIGYLFSELNWETHIPKICDFWESILLDHPVYSGNPMEAHLHLHQKTPLKAEHFTRWLQLFHHQLDSKFAGTITERARQRSFSIATVIQARLLQS